MVVVARAVWLGWGWADAVIVLANVLKQDKSENNVN